LVDRRLSIADWSENVERQSTINDHQSKIVLPSPHRPEA
jgi:hypothetical protein